jgi:hypothetical protein
MKQKFPADISPFFGIAKSNLPSKESRSGRQISVLDYALIKYHEDIRMIDVSFSDVYCLGYAELGKMIEIKALIQKMVEGGVAVLYWLQSTATPAAAQISCQCHTYQPSVLYMRRRAFGYGLLSSYHIHLESTM